MKSHIAALPFLAIALSIQPALADALSDSYLAMFRPLPSEVPAADNELTEAKINLGRMLYYETRLSKGGKMSCNSCHKLDAYGQDNLPFSPGHEGKLGGRSSPSTYNAALHIAQFWDGRAPTVEEQAKGPVLNPVEMGMPSADFVVEVLKSIPGYVEAFKAAFPGEADPINYDNFGKAVGAFERKLLTPSRWDEYLKGKKDALTAAEVKGYETFAKSGCVTCHNGPAVGGAMYQKLGLVKAWPELKDVGRMEATKQESDKFMFKVASLRNVTETAPYLHDGSVKTLEEMVSMMAEYQLGKTLSQEDVASIVTFLKALKGDIPKEYVAEPKLPESGPNTPKA
ncbi:MAG: cytochrome-c peroxidase [Prosthecobacter sp.]|jgi:cytochrome c peroxidase|nr:cytochrome-c peroxidase [Prosthecobacter sp.]